MMANLSENDRRALRFLAISLGAIGFLMVAGFPAMDYWQSLEDGIRAKEAKIREIDDGVKDAADAVQAMRKLEEKATIYPDPHALNEQTPRMQIQVESLPAYARLAVSRVEGMTPRREESYQRSAVSLQFSGSLEALHDFLSELEAARPQLKVERLSITASTDETSKSKIQGSMVIASYAVVIQQKSKREAKG